MNVHRLVCLVLAHRYTKAYFPDDDRPGQYFLRCRRCGHERGAPEAGDTDPGRYAWDVNPF